MASTENLSIELRDIVKRFGSAPAVSSVSLGIFRGEFFSLLGPSGCGKTTLLRLIAGFEYPDGGEIWIQGRNVANVAPNERPVNMVFQHYALFPHLNVYDNVAFGLRMRRFGKAQVDCGVREALSAVELEGFEKRFPHQLSGGQQQRVALARALANRPEVLLLDEPLAALDERLRKSMRQELKALQHRVGITFLYVTHDQEEALTLADRLAVMEGGRIVQLGTPQEIYEFPQSSFVADFVGISNLLPGRVAEVEQLLVSDNGSQGARRRAWIEVPDVGRVVAYIENGMDLGGEVVLALRPERIHLSTSQVEDLENRMSGKIERTVFLGSDVHYHVRLSNGKTLLARSIYSPLRRTRKEGDRVYLQWRAEDVSVLSA
ncbi:MAG: ABC transporter ATP-binding protein [Elusimicrobia bacterium]|nr:ABC transporter ATP-binding protein [Elusimicrobiota bacterium]